MFPFIRMFKIWGWSFLPAVTRVEAWLENSDFVSDIIPSSSYFEMPSCWETTRLLPTTVRKPSWQVLRIQKDGEELVLVHCSAERGGGGGGRGERRTPIFQGKPPRARARGDMKEEEDKEAATEFRETAALSEEEEEVVVVVSEWCRPLLRPIMTAAPVPALRRRKRNTTRKARRQGDLERMRSKREEKKKRKDHD